MLPFPEPNIKPVTLSSEIDSNVFRQNISKVPNKRRPLIVPKLTYQTASIEGEDFQNKIDNSFNLLFEAVAKTDVHKYN